MRNQTANSLCDTLRQEDQYLKEENSRIKAILFVFFLVVSLLCANTLAAESKSMTPEDEICQLMPLEGYPRYPLPPTDKTIVAPLPQTPKVPPPVPENHGAYNPMTGERYPPLDKGVYNPATGEYYPPSGDGYFNPRTGEYYPRVDH